MIWLAMELCPQPWTERAGQAAVFVFGQAGFVGLADRSRVWSFIFPPGQGWFP